MLGIRLAKEFQVLSGLEAIHRNSIQGTVHETLTLGHSAWEAAYSAILRDDIMEAECEATTHHLHSEADAAWKEMQEVMYNHQLEYDQQLAAFLKETDYPHQHEGPGMDHCLHPCRERGHHLQQLPESRTARTPPAPADPRGCLISDADTTHHHLLPRVLHLQKMALQTRWGSPPP